MQPTQTLLYEKSRYSTKMYARIGAANVLRPRSEDVVIGAPLLVVAPLHGTQRAALRDDNFEPFSFRSAWVRAERVYIFFGKPGPRFSRRLQAWQGECDYLAHVNLLSAFMAVHR